MVGDCERVLGCVKEKLDEVPDTASAGEDVVAGEELRGILNFDSFGYGRRLELLDVAGVGDIRDFGSDAAAWR
jgi:hypothetical protein